MYFLNDISTFKTIMHSFTQWWSMVLSSGATHHWVRKLSKSIYIYIWIMTGSPTRVSCKPLFQIFRILTMPSQYILLLIIFLVNNLHYYTFKLHWSTKILSHKEKCLFLMYFWTLNSNMFLEYLYHPHLLRCIRLCDRTHLRICVTGGL